MLFTSVPTKTLVQTITSSSTKLIVNNITGWNGSALTSSEFGTRLFAVLRNADNTIIEILELDPSTTAAGATTGFDILKAGMKFTGDLTTEVAASKLTWVKNQTFVELGSHVPQLLNHMVQLIGDQAIAGVKTFSSLPATTAGDAIADNDLVRKAQLDLAVLGQIGTDKLVWAGTAGETIADGDLVYFDTITNNEWMKSDANTAGSVNNALLGIAQGAGTDGVAITGGILLYGVDDAQSGLTVGNIIYASDTAGDISESAGTTEVVLGISKSATTIYFNPRYAQQITEDQQDAMVGKSGTTPSGSNLFIDEDYTAEAKTASKIPVRDANGDVLVTTTPTAGDAATSKTFVEAADAAVLAVVASKEYGVNTETADTYWTYTVPGITTFATSNNTVVDFNSYSRHTSSGAAYSTMGIMGNGSVPTYTAASGKELRVKFRVKFDGDEARLAVGLVQSNSAIHAVRTSVADGIRLIADSGVFYFSSANGTTNENTDIDSGLTDTNWNTVEFIFDPTVDAEIWVNGTLEGTHSTSLPDGALMFAIGQETGSGIIQISPITFSVEN